MNTTVDDFLRESNAIEDVWDEQSLIQARKAWHYLIVQNELTKQNILRVHAILMKGKLDLQRVGAWRRCAVWIGSKEARPHYAVPFLMDEFIKRVNFVVDSKYPQDSREQMSQSLHVHFESIHPFVDGNGRVGRILLNWIRVKYGLPILVIKESEKMEYYKWFS